MLSAVLTFAAVFFLLFPVLRKTGNNYLAAYTYGLVSHLLAFYWLFSTIKDFSGNGAVLSFCFYLLFILSHSLIFPLFNYLCLIQSQTFVDRLALAPAISWAVIEFFIPKLFPWDYAHTLQSFPYLVQIADIGGTALVSFVLIFLCTLLLKYILIDFKVKALAVAVLVAAITLQYGYVRFADFSQYTTALNSPRLNVSLVQGNISVFEKNQQKFLYSNIQTYLDQTESAIRRNQPDLIIWPESAISSPLDIRLKVATDSALLPDISGVNYLLGSLTQDFQEDKIMNSALAVNSNLQHFDVYHKKILMPFGEYIPFSSIFPFLKDFNQGLANFTAGTRQSVFNYGSGIYIAPLICYEDLLPALSIKAVDNQANLLVNLTNDAWFGKSVAAEQHNLIASYRAIENRRFLLRSTNTGLTTAIDLNGQLVASLPQHQIAVLNQTVVLNDSKTIYNQYFYYGWRIFMLLCMIYLVSFKFIKKCSD